jgi:hypothetical protein
MQHRRAARGGGRSRTMQTCRRSSRRQREKQDQAAARNERIERATAAARETQTAGGRVDGVSVSGSMKREDDMTAPPRVSSRAAVDVGR